MEFDADVHDDDKESIMKQRRRRIENLIDNISDDDVKRALEEIWLWLT